MSDASDERLFGVVLAAGASRRLGRPKQLIEYDGETLLVQAIRKLKSVVGADNLVVLGYEWDSIFEACRDALGFVVINPDWMKGLSTSLIAACRSVPDSVGGILVTVSDQPLVTDTFLAELSGRWQTDKTRIVAARYRHGPGVPAILPARLFDAITTLSGDAGARQLFQGFEEHVVTLDCPAAAIDIDTPADLESLARRAPVANR